MISPITFVCALIALAVALEFDFFLESTKSHLPVGLEAMAGKPEEDLFSATKDGRYRFLVAGHVYGRHDDSDGLFWPMKNAWKDISEANRPDFAVLTGDVVMRGNNKSWDKIDRDLALFGKPVYLAPGNHDGGYAGKAKDKIIKRYGARSKAWMLGQDAFLCCDTHRFGGKIDGIDLTALKELCAKKPRALFIFVHHLVWVDIEKASDLAVRGLVNGIGAGYAEVSNFDTVIMPLLEASGAEVYVIGGDVGAGSKIVEWHDEPRPGIHLLASGMGEHPHVGTYLLFDISPDAVEVECVSLNRNDTRIKKGRLGKN